MATSIPAKAVLEFTPRPRTLPDNGFPDGGSIRNQTEKPVARL